MLQFARALWQRPHVYAGPPGQDLGEIFAIIHPPAPNTLFAEILEFTGEFAPRGEVHTKGYWHRSVHVWFYDPASQKLLLQQRSKHKDTNPGLWDVSAAGHITGSDPVDETVCREVGEELGVERRFSAFKFLFTVVASGKRGEMIDNEFQHVFVGIASEATEFMMGETEVAALRWLPIKEVNHCLLSGDPAFVRRPAHYISGLFNALTELSP
eukprot:TRINITY_DN12232_c0_g1_i1.p1 TRINITY_DN12232_c0_g1~~TRINITY_DN12232_c0_g1_i1.p1  ORF type:complete len:212 (-),score=21.63 TRINITY_DN12232_c0_g1_i1:14-649(-)